MINGFSELFVEVFGPENGRHARSAVTMALRPALTTGCMSSRSEPVLFLRRTMTTGRSSTFQLVIDTRCMPSRSSTSVSVRRV